MMTERKLAYPLPSRRARNAIDLARPNLANGGAVRSIDALAGERRALPVS